MLVSTLRWRESFDVGAAVKEEFPVNIFERVGHLSGRDKEGHPVVYVVCSLVGLVALTATHTFQIHLIWREQY